MLDLNDHKHNELEFIGKEKDLGVIFENDLTFSSHIIKLNKANQLIGLMRRSYTYLDKKSLRYLFNAIVRPHLKYYVSIWYPLLNQDEELIENVLCRASKLMPRTANFSYADRLHTIDTPDMSNR